VPLAVVLSAFPPAAFPRSPVTPGGEPASQALDAVTITGDRLAPIGATRLDGQTLRGRRTRGNDTARLLEDIPGVSTYGTGAISSLPVIWGLADDRLRTRVDGVDLEAACPNHMNPALSFIDPSKVLHVQVYAGIAPVSVGGDSIGGTIEVNSAPPQFANANEGVLYDARLGFTFRGNGNGRAKNMGFSLATQFVNLNFEQSFAESDNYRAARNFKLDGLWKSLGESEIPDDVVAVSELRGAVNRELSVALRPWQDHIIEMRLSEQSLDVQGFPNQRMDMVSSAPDEFNFFSLRPNEPANINNIVNLNYTGDFSWGELTARASRQTQRHSMDMLQDRFFGMFMPMISRSTTHNGEVAASIEVSERDILRLGIDYQDYSYDDVWPPVGDFGAMCCEEFVNIRDGRRDRLASYAEWERAWDPHWLSQLGIRGGTVTSNAGPVQGYNEGLYGDEAAEFNARDRHRIDQHLDATALLRFTPTTQQTYDAGVARKTRSPNLLERYTWTYESMASSMNNFVGDGNAYVGNLDLRPEIAYTASASGAWHDTHATTWNLRITGHVTHVHDFIDAERCTPEMSIRCSEANVTTDNEFVQLRYVNQDARLYGIDVSGSRLLGNIDGFGSFTANGILSYLRGQNLETGDNLFQIMPLNLRLGLTHRLAGWTMAVDGQLVAAKENISRVRNEIVTPGFGLLHLRAGYEWKNARVDLELENALNTFYRLPLGGAYVGQGNSMALNAIPWGMAVPGRARSFNVAVNISY